MTGWEITNGGQAGITTKEWYDEKFNNYNMADYQFFLMELGYNGGLTDTLDTDVIPFENYEDFADTQTGNYCKIISKILSINPNAYIVLIISSSFNDTNATVVQKIGELYNLNVIDLRDNSYIDLKSLAYHGYNNNSSSYNMIHFNALGYLAKAKLILYDLINIFSSNQKEFNNSIKWW